MLNNLSVLPFILNFQLKKKFKYLNILGFRKESCFSILTDFQQNIQNEK